MSERANAVSSGTPSSDTVVTFASGTLNISANSVGDARWPMVFSGFGTRAKLTPFWSKNDNVQSFAWTLAFDDAAGTRRATD